MTKAQETKNIHQRLAAAMAEVTYIQKESKKGMLFTIVSHDAVTAKVRPVLLKNGIVYYPTRCSHTHNGNRAECSMTVRFVNIDDPADMFEVETFGYGVDGQDKGPGKAMSYAVKYALLKALGLETGDDADHDSIDHSRQDPAAPKVTREQAASLADLAENSGSDIVKTLRAKGLKGDSWADLPADMYEAAFNGMTAKIAKMKTDFNEPAGPDVGDGDNGIGG